jgi:hypothetical protein
MAPKRNAALEAMIEEATVDAYNDDEQLTGLFTMLEEHLVVPFATMDLPLPTHHRNGSVWIDVYRYWAGR